MSEALRGWIREDRGDGEGLGASLSSPGSLSTAPGCPQPDVGVSKRSLQVLPQGRLSPCGGGGAMEAICSVRCASKVAFSSSAGEQSSASYYFYFAEKNGKFGLAEGNETPVQGQAPVALAKKPRKITQCG